MKWIWIRQRDNKPKLSGTWGANGLFKLWFVFVSEINWKLNWANSYSARRWRPESVRTQPLEKEMSSVIAYSAQTMNVVIFWGRLGDTAESFGKHWCKKSQKVCEEIFYCSSQSSCTVCRWMNHQWNSRWCCSLTQNKWVVMSLYSHSWSPEAESYSLRESYGPLWIYNVIGHWFFVQCFVLVQKGKFS